MTHPAPFSSHSGGERPGAVRFSGTGRRPEPAPNLSRAAVIRHALIIAVVASLLTLGLRGLGLTDAIDTAVRRGHRALTPASSGAHELVLVAIDEATVAAWGRPPWPIDNVRGLLAAIDAGNPTLIALLEPGWPALGDGAPSDWPAVAARLTAGRRARVITAETATRFAQPSVQTDARGVAQAIELGGGGQLLGPTVAREVVSTLGFTVEDTALPVIFQRGPRDVPTVSAFRVARADVPAASFAGRVVLIGVTAPALAPQVATPLGSLSAAEVHVLALLEALYGKALRSLPAVAAILLAGLFAFPCAILFGRLKTTRALTFSAVLVALVLLADFVLATVVGLRVGVSAPIVGLATGGAGIWFLERIRANRELVALGRSIAQQFSLESERRGNAESEEEFWQRLGAAINYYLEFDSMVFGALPDGAWHLDLRVFINVEGEDIFERRRDIRRVPYRDACAHHRPVWSERQFMKPERQVKSLMIPLVAFGRIVGFWVVNFPVAAVVTPGQIEFVRLVADQIAVALERRRLREASVNDPVSHLPVDMQLLGRIQETRAAAMTMAHEQQSLLSLLDRLPVGGLVATLWGEIKFTNQAMQRFLRKTGRVPDGNPSHLSLARLVAELTGGADESVYEILRELVVGGQVVRLTGKPQAPQPAAFDLLLSRFGMDGGNQAPQLPGRKDEPLASSGIVLALSQRGETRDDVVDWTLRLRSDRRNPDQTIDLRAAITEAVSALASGSDKPQRTVLVELPEALPAVRATDDFAPALRDLLRQSAFESAPTPLRLHATASDREVTLALSDPHAILPGDELRIIRTGTAEAGDIPEHLQRFVAARRAVEDSWGRFQITSGMADGTEIRMSLTTKARQPDR